MITRLARMQGLTADKTDERILNVLKSYGLPYECGLLIKEPPTEESTWASREVGICTNFTPRKKLAAANPARSPITPPPRAMIRSLLEWEK